jgi:hypothetical protein
MLFYFDFSLDLFNQYCKEVVMDLRIVFENIKFAFPFSKGDRKYIGMDLELVDNIDEIIESLVDKCDPASLVTSSNKDGILDYIGIEYAMKYFDLKQEKEDYGMRDSDFI